MTGGVRRMGRNWFNTTTRNRAMSLATLLMVGLGTVAVSALIKSTHDVDFYNIVPGLLKTHGPHSAVLQISPYLDDTDPNGRCVKVGVIEVGEPIFYWRFRCGSGSGTAGSNGDYYDAWQNWDSVTINIHGHVTITRN